MKAIVKFAAIGSLLLSGAQVMAQSAPAKGVVIRVPVDEKGMENGAGAEMRPVRQANLQPTAASLAAVFETTEAPIAATGDHADGSTESWYGGWRNPGWNGRGGYNSYYWGFRPSCSFGGNLFDYRSANFFGGNVLQSLYNYYYYGAGF